MRKLPCAIWERLDEHLGDRTTNHRLVGLLAAGCVLPDAATQEEIAMHECNNCGQACDCDIEDMWYDTAPDDCSCECEGMDDEDDYE